MKMFKTPQHGEVGEDLLTTVMAEEQKKPSVKVPLISFNGLVLYGGMDVTLSLKVSIFASSEYRILARRVKSKYLYTTSGSITYKEYIDPVPLRLPEDNEIRVIEVFYKLGMNEIFLRCDVENDAIHNSVDRPERIVAANNLINELKSKGFEVFKSDKYGDLFVE